MDRLWVQWFNFQHRPFEGKDRGGSLELPPPEPQREEGSDLHYFLLGDKVFALMPWMAKPYSRRQLTREEKIAIYRISRDRWLKTPLESYRAALGYYWAPWSKGHGLSDIVFICVVLHNLLRTHQGWADRVPTIGNDVAAHKNKQEVFVSNGNYRNPLREAKHQTELL